MMVRVSPYVPATQDPARMMKGLKAEDVEVFRHQGSREFSDKNHSSRNEREWMAIQIDSRRAGLLRTGEGVQAFLGVPVHRYGPKHYTMWREEAVRGGVLCSVQTTH
jgi:hypothetical protein